MQRLKQINRYSKDDLVDGEDSDGKVILTSKQKLGREAAIEGLDTILFGINKVHRL